MTNTVKSLTCACCCKSHNALPLGDNQSQEECIMRFVDSRTVMTKVARSGIGLYSTCVVSCRRYHQPTAILCFGQQCRAKSLMIFAWKRAIFYNVSPQKTLSFCLVGCKPTKFKDLNLWLKQLREVFLCTFTLSYVFTFTWW